MTFLSKDLSNEIKVILNSSGQILLSYFRKKINVSKKQHQYVTDADLESENFLKKELLSLYPEAAIWAEESGRSGESDYCWVIDPLDGTSNFICGIPYFCISVALTYKNQPILGAVFDPIHNELFYAQKNKGAFLNGMRIFVSGKKALSDSLLVMSFPSGWEEKYTKYCENIKNIRRRCYGLRLMGASALDLAYIACGRYDATFFYKLKWWDIAAGMLLIEEAGGKVSDFEGNAISPNFESLLAGPSLIINDLMGYL